MGPSNWSNSSEERNGASGGGEESSWARTDAAMQNQNMNPATAPANFLITVTLCACGLVSSVFGWFSAPFIPGIAVASTASGCVPLTDVFALIGFTIWVSQQTIVNISGANDNKTVRSQKFLDFGIKATLPINHASHGRCSPVAGSLGSSLIKLRIESSDSPARPKPAT